MEPVENVELLHKELDAGGHEQVGQVVAVDLITRTLILIDNNNNDLVRCQYWTIKHFMDNNSNDLRSNKSIKQGGI